MAGILERMAIIVKANVNELLEKYEDPEKIVDQSIIEAKEELARVKKESLPVLANESETKRQLDSYSNEASKWHTIAANALKSGDEAGARKALEEESRLRKQVVSQESTYQAAKAAADKLREEIALMEEEISEMQKKAALIKAKATTAKATRATAELKAKGEKRGGFEAFARMEEKAHKELAEAEALRSLNTDHTSQELKELEKMYSGGENASSEDALTALKAELGI